MSLSPYYTPFPDLQRLARACEQDATFRANFGTEEACRRWFFRARWPDGFRCPDCGGGGGRMSRRNVIECRKCRKQTSLTSGTLLHATRKPLKTWFAAVYLIVQRGVNAKTLQRELGLTYKVAWTWGHKLRAALKPHTVPANAEKTEELRFEASRTPRGWLIAPSPDRKEPCGCTRLTSRDWLFPNEREEERQATRAERAHRRGVRVPEQPIPPDSPPRPDALEHWNLLATFMGSLSEKHLRSYLDEHAFRENRRERPVGEGFLTLARAIAVTPPHSYRRVVARPAPEGHPLSIFKTAGWSRLRARRALRDKLGP